jgi:endonuclease-3 related protein
VDGRAHGDDPGLEATSRSNFRGPFVGTPPPARAPRRWARDARLDRLLRELHAGFGVQSWWPAETPFEVVVGAILTQNTAWTNVERALANLRARACLTPRAILACDPDVLRECLRPSGYFNAKTRKLQEVARWYLEAGGLRALRERELEPLRAELLLVHGVGPESADSILCYAAGRRTAVVDTYTRRILSRHALADGNAPYEELRAWLMERLSRSQWVFEEFHALFVRAGYEHCKPSARCATCPATTPAALRNPPHSSNKV